MKKQPKGWEKIFINNVFDNIQNMQGIHTTQQQKKPNN